MAIEEFDLTDLDDSAEEAARENPFEIPDGDYIMGIIRIDLDAVADENGDYRRFMDWHFEIIEGPEERLIGWKYKNRQWLDPKGHDPDKQKMMAGIALRMIRATGVDCPKLSSIWKVKDELRDRIIRVTLKSKKYGDRVFQNVNIKRQPTPEGEVPW